MEEEYVIPVHQICELPIDGLKRFAICFQCVDKLRLAIQDLLWHDRTA